MSSFSPGEQRSLLAPQVLATLGPAFDPFAPITQAWEQSAGAPLLARATHLDAVTYLPNDILMKVDRASMSVALEARAPFLARDVVEFAFSLPDQFRMKGLTGKRLLRDATRDLLPPAILQRPKKGFGIPVAAWLNGPLRKLADELLSPDALPPDLVRPEAVTRLLSEHRAGSVDHRKPLWTLLVFSLWHAQHIATAAAPKKDAGAA
jgi:asparagine synthase (glutamine-hydrolysing)